MELSLPIKSINGASIKNKYLSTLMSACTLDGNFQIVPLEFVVVESENDLSWYWFSCNLKASFREPNDLVVVFDAHKSIADDFNFVYELA